MLTRAIVLAAALLLTLAPLAPASADHLPKTCEWVGSGKDAVWTCTSPGHEGTPGGGNEGAGGEPPCDLSQPPYNEFCDGTASCWGNDPAANPPSEDLAGPQPSPEHHMAYKACKRADGSLYDEWYWANGTGPTPEQAALEALGRLKLPVFTPGFNPENRTLVGLDTWWYADGVVVEEVTSTAALGVRAIATPDRLEVDPGDGSGVVSCEFVTTPSEACSHVYRRSNAGYPARMRGVYSIRFEQNGVPFPVAAAPAEIGTPWQSRAVPVGEVQSTVTSVR